MTIKQDWILLKQSQIKINKAKHKIDVFCKNAVEDCSVGEYYDNYMKTCTLPDLNYKTTNQDFVNWTALQHRSSYCFYKVPEPQYPLGKCVNVRLDGTVSVCCKKCPNYNEMKTLSSLLNDIEHAKQDRNKALRKLLSNVFFWTK